MRSLLLKRAKVFHNVLINHLYWIMTLLLLPCGRIESQGMNERHAAFQLFINCCINFHPRNTHIYYLESLYEVMQHKLPPKKYTHLLLGITI